MKIIDEAKSFLIKNEVMREEECEQKYIEFEKMVADAISLHVEGMPHDEFVDCLSKAHSTATNELNVATIDKLNVAVPNRGKQKRAVSVYNKKTNEFICELESITKASELLSIDRVSIQRVLSGKRKSARKWVFKYTAVTNKAVVLNESESEKVVITKENMNEILDHMLD